MSNTETKSIEEQAALMKLNEEHQEEKESKLTAAAALAGLVDSPAPKDEPTQVESNQEFHIPQRYTRSGRKRAVSFPLKLMKVLSKKEFNDIITWMPSGKSFNIINSKRFTAEILPEYFKSAKYSSFTRKLHRWGFIRHYRGEEAGAFFHKNFQKARFDLVEKMTCCKQEPPKSSMAIAAAAAAEPVPPQQITTATHTPLLRPIAQPPVLAAAAPAAPVVGLDAAIEIEVARRVQERIDAAALRRFAMIRQEQQMMQEHDFLQRQEQQLLRQQHERQMQQQLAQEQQLKATLVSAWSQPRIELLKRTAALAVNPKPAPLPARNFGSRPADLPETNIYSAKTA